MNGKKIAEDSFFSSVRAILSEARRKAAASINFVMVEAYWRIGEQIVEEEQKGQARAGYGKELIHELSRRLGDEFGKGFSVANLWNFRQFYHAFPDEEKLYALRRELGWSHYRLIMRVDEPEARQFYIDEAADYGWTTRELERNIRSGWHRRLLHRPATDVPAHPLRPQSLLKDPYIFEFLGLSEDTRLHENDLESALIANLRDFLLELGRGFSFVGRQFRISTETSHFYIDLVFYNYLLKCFVLIDLKTGKLTHQDIGQMDMYVRMFDDLRRGEDDNPTLGMILCADRDETVVHYSVLRESRQLFAAKYLRVLPSEEELARELEARHVLDLGREGGA
jgi:predicted nuclease of restriction endonuclease-like (RecB) superfamily